MLRLQYAAEKDLEGSSMLPKCSVLPLYPHLKQMSKLLSEGCVPVCSCNQGACLAMLVIPQASAERRRALSLEAVGNLDKAESHVLAP